MNIPYKKVPILENGYFSYGGQPRYVKKRTIICILFPFVVFYMGSTNERLQSEVQWRLGVALK